MLHVFAAWEVSEQERAWETSENLRRWTESRTRRPARFLSKRTMQSETLRPESNILRLSWRLSRFQKLPSKSVRLVRLRTRSRARLQWIWSVFALSIQCIKRTHWWALNMFQEKSGHPNLIQIHRRWCIYKCIRYTRFWFWHKASSAIASSRSAWWHGGKLRRRLPGKSGSNRKQRTQNAESIRSHADLWSLTCQCLCTIFLAGVHQRSGGGCTDWIWEHAPVFVEMQHDQTDKIEDGMRGFGEAKDAGGRVVIGVLVSTLERESEAFPLLGFAGF